MCDAKMANSTLVSYSSYNAREATNRTKSITESLHTTQSSNKSTPPFQETHPDCLPFIREKLGNQNLSRAAQDIIISSWRKGTTKQDRTYLLRWQEICRCEGLSLNSPGMGNAIEFLTEMYKSRLGYSAINTARSALSSIILPTSGVTFAKDPLVCPFFKGGFELKPCLPKYNHIWDINAVLSYLKTFDPTKEMALKDITTNLATLHCLLTGQRCQTIHKINLNFIQFHDE